ncbi:MAG: hypothetical protein B6D39_06205 [Anaerolineae bacterium UTCFX2]|jgi:cellulose synthase/poly-beta-1,6-N-acetylglucosamine synthase-like glycosyltransferase|nr:MAG: hypothetical protein B6D39_06205 [Anaerolineae bacterium UTCFX2]
MAVLAWLVIIALLVPLCYWYLLAFGSLRKRQPFAPDSVEPSQFFMLAIPAHNEETVIEETVARLKRLHYPESLYHINIVADYCTDRTAELARAAGANVYERQSGERGGKSAALNWLFSVTLPHQPYDAVIVFDADTQVDPDFLSAMNVRLSQGHQAIQGQHAISNPSEGWFPALTWALFLVDNRFQNLGRSNLGFSAKNMGDSICIKADLLRKLAWGSGLTEDYNLRQKMLLAGAPIFYEPQAVAYGESPRNWSEARAQRARWLRGTHDSSRNYANQLLKQGLHDKDPMVLEGALQALLPSYSTLTMICLLALMFCFAANLLFGPLFSGAVFAALAGILALLFIYPLVGLALERAPLRAYLAILTGPVYIVWRTVLAIKSRYWQKQVAWIRTPHGKRGDE